MKNHHCPICQSTIPENAPGGLCPTCVLRDADEAPASGPAAPSIAEIAAAFPQLQEISLIGQGGMGFVYKARQPGLDRTIALKILAPALSGDPAFSERFAREARTLGKLHHPNIVTIFEHGESKGYFYLMMEYVDGVNLRQAMRAGRFAPEQALAIVPGICDALQTAHEQGVWHRDIKPENILLDREGRVKIADFGIARIVGDPQRDFTLTMTGNALGSAAYMAPEQHEKPHDVDHRADIYSLGVVIYEMLTGELPLGRFPAPSQRAAVDARIDEIVLKTLEKERDMRQQSATEVKTDVHRALQPGGIQNSQSAVPAASKASGMAKLGCVLLLGGALVLLLFPPFGVIAIVLALVLGLMTWRERLGKFVTIGSALLLLLCVLSIPYLSLSSKVKHQGPSTMNTLSQAGDAMIHVEFKGLSSDEFNNLTEFVRKLAESHSAFVEGSPSERDVGDHDAYTGIWNNGFVDQKYKPNHPIPSPEVEASMKASLESYLDDKRIYRGDVKFELQYGL
jgi:serine/threonine protein kinase